MHVDFVVATYRLLEGVEAVQTGVMTPSGYINSFSLHLHSHLENQSDQEEKDMSPKASTPDLLHVTFRGLTVQFSWYSCPVRTKAPLDLSPAAKFENQLRSLDRWLNPPQMYNSES